MQKKYQSIDSGMIVIYAMYGMINIVLKTHIKETEK